MSVTKLGSIHKSDAQHSSLRKFLHRKLMISNCKLYRINKRILIFPCLPAGRGCCREELWKKDADTGTATTA